MEKRNSGVRVRTGVRAGGIGAQHSRVTKTSLRVRAAVKVGGMDTQRSRAPLNNSRQLRR